MAITLLKLEAKDMVLAEHLAPEGMLCRLALPHCSGVIAVDEEAKVPVGLVIYSYSRANRLDIEWLFVYETYRGKGIGSDLLEMMFTVANKAKIPFVGLLLEGAFASEENINAMRGFANAWGFSFGADAKGDWVITMEQYDAAMADKNKSNTENIKQAGQIDEKLIRNYLNQNYDKLASSPLYDYKEVLEKYDRTLSVVYYRNGEILGVFLVQMLVRELFVLAFDAKEPKGCILLMEGMRANIQKLRVHMSVRAVYSTRAAKVLSELFPTLGAQPAYLWISDADYIENEAKEDFTDFDIFAKQAPDNYRWLKTETYGDVTF